MKATRIRPPQISPSASVAASLVRQLFPGTTVTELDAQARGLLDVRAECAALAKEIVQAVRPLAAR